MPNVPRHHNKLSIFRVCRHSILGDSPGLEHKNHSKYSGLKNEGVKDVKMKLHGDLLLQWECLKFLADFHRRDQAHLNKVISAVIRVLQFKVCEIQHYYFSWVWLHRNEIYAACVMVIGRWPIWRCQHTLQSRELCIILWTAKKSWINCKGKNLTIEFLLYEIQLGIAQNLQPWAYAEIIYDVGLFLEKGVNHDNSEQSLGLLTFHKEILCTYL